MAFVFYTCVNFSASHMALHHDPSAQSMVLVSQVMVYEVLLLWSSNWVCVCLTVLFLAIAILNVIFTSFIAYE